MEIYSQVKHATDLHGFSRIKRIQQESVFIGRVFTLPEGILGM